MRKLVSVVVVTFNSETEIADCLASIERQTYTTLETLVIDNNSRIEAAGRHLEKILNQIRTSSV